MSDERQGHESSHGEKTLKFIDRVRGASGHRLQMNVKFLERIPGTRKRLYRFTAIDDCTRIRVLKVYEVCNQRSAIQFLNEARQRLPFRIQFIQTDNGAEFQSEFNKKLREWEDYYNYHPPHGALEGQTPFERLMAKTRADVSPVRTVGVRYSWKPRH